MSDMHILRIISLVVWAGCLGLGVYLWKWHKIIDGYAVPVVILFAHQVTFYLAVLIFTLSPQFVNNWSASLRLHDGLTWLIYLVLIPILISRRRS